MRQVGSVFTGTREGVGPSERCWQRGAGAAGKVRLVAVAGSVWAWGETALLAGGGVGPL